MKIRNLWLILLVFALVIAFMAAVYISGAVPGFNSAMETAFAGVFKKGGSIPEQQENSATTAKKETASRKTNQKDGYELTSDGYSLASVGKNRWIYESSWPFVTLPVVLNNTVVSVTSEPAFVTLSVEKGELLSKQECPVYPGEILAVEGSTLKLTGRDGQQYLFQVEADGSFTDIRSIAEDKKEGLFLSKLAPEAKTADFMNTRLREWSSDSERKLPEMKLYTGHINKEGNGNFWAQKNDDEATVFYVFTPDKQGMYQVGLSDINGAWVTANAFVAVFGESGDLKQVSLDYVANKPVIKLHLSDTEMYYIVAGWAKDMYDGTETWLQIAESR